MPERYTQKKTEQFRTRGSRTFSTPLGIGLTSTTHITKFSHLIQGNAEATNGSVDIDADQSHPTPNQTQGQYLVLIEQNSGTSIRLIYQLPPLQLILTFNCFHFSIQLYDSLLFFWHNISSIFHENNPAQPNKTTSELR